MALLESRHERVFWPINLLSGECATGRHWSVGRDSCVWTHLFPRTVCSGASLRVTCQLRDGVSLAVALPALPWHYQPCHGHASLCLHPAWLVWCRCCSCPSPSGVAVTSPSCSNIFPARYGDSLASLFLFFTSSGNSSFS